MIRGSGTPPDAEEGGRTRPGPLAGLLLGAALGATLFLLAGLIHDRVLSRGRRPSAPPRGFAMGSDARAPVRVLATLGGKGLQAVLLPLREDGASPAAEEGVLDAALFPGGPPRRWGRLLVANPPGGAAFVLDLRPGGVVLDAAGGPVRNEDLAGAVAARLPDLSPHRLLDLRVAHAADTSVEVPPGGFVRTLVAFPAGPPLSSAAGAALEGGVRLLPREVPVERIRSVLLDGRVDALLDAERAQAKGKTAPGVDR